MMSTSRSETVLSVDTDKLKSGMPSRSVTIVKRLHLPTRLCGSNHQMVGSYAAHKSRFPEYCTTTSGCSTVITTNPASYFESASSRLIRLCIWRIRVTAYHPCDVPGKTSSWLNQRFSRKWKPDWLLSITNGLTAKRTPRLQQSSLQLSVHLANREDGRSDSPGSLC